jgi:8-oxo-dGTP pyrophosphatase MutT (NUDIX family)
MTYEKSCGIVPYIVINGEILYVLITQNNGITCFPKGHVEKGETEEQTALRECFEETK